jgi:hypothetical protein
MGALVNERSAQALKEWAAIEQVLAAGASSLLLRKGGLWERREGFEMEHREFWIFPTLFHQNPHELRPEFSWALESARAAHPDGDRVRLEHYAVVTDAFRVESLETLAGLAEFQSLTPETIEARFRYKNRPYLHAMLLRVYRVPAPHIIPNTLGYEGCISWVELDEPLGTGGAVPVLGDEEFAAVREAVVGKLGGEEGESRS